MSKYDFKPAQRYAVYKAFNGVCQWCKGPVEFSSFHVDHVLPEELLNKPEEMRSIFKAYSLPADFNINDYENWTVLHPDCNLRKSSRVYGQAPVILNLLDTCKTKKELEQRIEMMLAKEPKKAEVLAKVEAAINLSVVNIQDLQNFLLRTDMIETNDEELDQIRKGIEKRVEYQTEKMVLGVVDVLTVQSNEVVSSIARNLGPDWNIFTPKHYFKKANDTPHGIIAGIQNRINDGLSIHLVINPEIVGKKLSITFREFKLGDEETETFYSCTYDLEKGITWEEYRELITSFFKERLKNV